jgi:polyisoprenoid-binding protein YceI
MSRNLIFIVAGVALVGVLTATAVAAYVLRPPATPSGSLTAIPVVAPTETEASVATSTNAPATETAEQTLLSTDPITAELVQAESEARFLIDEVLNNQSKTVVGVTDQVAAQLIIDPANPANVQMGPVTINARTLVTDNNFRNRAIQNEILDTAEFEFITFTPTQFVGLPSSGTIGETFVFQIIGDLSIRDVTREVTFDLSVTVDSGTQLHGLGTTTISRQNFDLGVIELPPQVASLKDSVILELEFVAQAVQ